MLQSAGPCSGCSWACRLGLDIVAMVRIQCTVGLWSIPLSFVAREGLVVFLCCLIKFETMDSSPLADLRIFLILANASDGKIERTQGGFDLRS